MAFVLIFILNVRIQTNYQFVRHSFSTIHKILIEFLKFKQSELINSIT